MPTIADKYYEVIPGQLVITTTEKCASTSIHYALRHKPLLRPAEIRKRRGLKVRLYLRHPIGRLASAWAYFTKNTVFPHRAFGKGEGRTPTIEQFIDAILDRDVRNEHWNPQCAQHEIFNEIARLEGIEYTWPHGHTRELAVHNPGRMEKPRITYRLADLEDHYREDLTYWTETPPGGVLWR